MCSTGARALTSRSITTWSFCRKRDANQPAVQTFPCMVIDCCTQIFQIATGPSGPPAGFHILPASLRIHLSQHLAAEEIVQTTDPVGELRYFRLRGASFEVSRLAMA